jgi:ferritin
VNISKTMQDAFNEQIKNEYYSAYLYLSMSAYFESMNLPGSAKWMRTQHDEELTHALKMFDFVNDRDGRVTLKAIDQPTADFASPLVVWEMVLEHERKVTGLIYKLYDQAVKENDYASQTFLAWFVNEQVEEEKNASLMLERFKQAGTSPASLLLFDGHFTKRGE